MAPAPGLRPRWSLLRLSLVVIAAACLPADAFAYTEDVSGEDSGIQLMNARMAQELNYRSERPSTSATGPDTLWLGHTPGHTGNYWQVGPGAARPGYDVTGMWTFDAPVHGDSLQGWWPIRRVHTNFTGATRTDENRPWWAVEYGNVANYRIHQRYDLNDPSAPGNRTTGVVGVWHRDPGNVVAATIPGTNPQPPTWTPLAGSYSAWMGIRAHGDLTVQDPITGNYVNGAIVERFGGASTAPGHANQLLPGYIGNMDQLLYRDIDLSGAPPATGVTIKFTYRTNMSTQKDTDARFRTGWHEGDPLSQNLATPGNFISAEAGAPANSQAPIDSFQVYIGAPVDDAAWLTSLNDTRPVYDPHRRWMNEILQRDGRRWLFGAAGDHASSQVVVTLSAGDRDALLAAAAAAGHPGRLRLVFRVHTNRTFDDANGSVSGSYSSGKAGAAVLDNVIANIGGGDVVIGDFEASGSIDNALAVDPVNAWKSTGKPPGTYFHAHDVAALAYQDICGPVGSPNRTCDLSGAVISMGLHDQGEASSDPAPLSTEHEGFWGIMSPTIGLVTTGMATPNPWGVTGDRLAQLDDIRFVYDIYSGYFDTFTTGQLWQVGAQSYPGMQSDGTKAWGGMNTSDLQFNPEQQCFRVSNPIYSRSLILTSNPNGIPDSVRVFFQKLSQCYRFGVTTGCSSTDGGYLDNMSVAIIRSAGPVGLQADIWDLFGDAFPANETAGLPGTAAFDTAAAHVKIGLNTAPSTGDLFRYNVPGDSLTVQAAGDSIRLDLMFRIKPGVGNYITIGNPPSGLRQVPTSPAQAMPGDGSFWGSYMGNPGAFSGPAGQINSGAATAMHLNAPGGWSELVWNSARMDSTESGGQAMFPNQRRNIQSPQNGTQWCSTYHEADLAGPRASLGIPRNRCFVIDTTATNINDPNVTCGDPAKGPYPPAWVTTQAQSYTGWDGTTTTIEGTKILPDGQLTPGAHVQYFIRRQDLAQPVSSFSMLPDTNRVYPQAGEGNLDGHRWQQFAILPDRWKDPAFGKGGVGMACLLFVDGADRRGEERVWKAIADSSGMTSSAHRGNADGYGRVPPDGDVNDPQYFISDKNQQMGSLWDAYQVKAGESGSLGAMQIGGRLGYRGAGTGMDGKWTFTPPTLEMLNAYYKLILYTSGDLNFGILRPYGDATSNDVGLLQNWLAAGDPGYATRSLLAMGNGFVAATANQGPPQTTFVSDYLGVTLVAPNYLLYAPNVGPFVDMPVTSAVDLGQGHIFGLRNECTGEFGVIAANGSLPEASPVSYYGSVASGHIAAVHKVHNATRPWIALTTGHSLQALRTRFGDNTRGRWIWFYDVFNNVLASFNCPLSAPTVLLDTPQAGDGNLFVDFAGLRNNPVRSGHAIVAFGLARADRVQIAVYDVSGRRVRALANRLFTAGEHELVWDGRDDAGNVAARGVYFTRLRYSESGFEQAAKLTILK